jgi:hypothetical protein
MRRLVMASVGDHRIFEAAVPGAAGLQAHVEADTAIGVDRRRAAAPRLDDELAAEIAVAVMGPELKRVGRNGRRDAAAPNATAVRVKRSLSPVAEHSGVVLDSSNTPRSQGGHAESNRETKRDKRPHPNAERNKKNTLSSYHSQSSRMYYAHPSRTNASSNAF